MAKNQSERSSGNLHPWSIQFYPEQTTKSQSPSERLSERLTRLEHEHQARLEQQRRDIYKIIEQRRQIEKDRQIREELAAEAEERKEVANLLQRLKQTEENLGRVFNVPLNWLGSLFGSSKPTRAKTPTPSQDPMQALVKQVKREGFIEGYEEGLLKGKASTQQIVNTVVDFRAELRELVEALSGVGPLVLPADVRELITSIDVPKLQLAKVGAAVSKLNDATKKIKALSGDYKDLQDAVVSLGNGRRVTAVKISLAAMPGKKTEVIEVTCTPQEATTLIQKEMQKVHERIGEAQREAYQALNDLAPGVGLPPPTAVAAADPESANRRIRRSPVNVPESAPPPRS